MTATRVTVPSAVAGETIPVSWLTRSGASPAVLALPGLGMSAAEGLGVPPARVLPGRALLVPDVPGTGETRAVDDLSVEDVAELAAHMIRRQGGEPVVVVGHSMGGVAGLVLCRRHPELVAGFVNVEGNLGPGDCFVSRRIVAEPFPGIVASLARSRKPGMARFARALRALGDTRSVVGLSRSLVAHCAGSPLLDWFLGLSMPRTFITGTATRGLPYLGELREAGVPVVTLSRSGHFPMYSRPKAYWEAVQAFAAGGVRRATPR